MLCFLSRQADLKNLDVRTVAIAYAVVNVLTVSRSFFQLKSQNNAWWLSTRDQYFSKNCEETQCCRWKGGSAQGLKFGPELYSRTMKSYGHSRPYIRRRRASSLLCRLTEHL